jgi:ATP-binding cassette subfamily B protein
MIMVLNISIVGLLYSVSRNIRQFAESFGNVMQGLETIYGKTEKQVSHRNDKAKNIKCHYNDDIPHKGEISVIDLNFSYPMSGQIFNNISITIPPAQKIGLVGYSGGGKTTFMNLILGLFEVNSGQILIDGQDISKIPREILYSKIGVIPQDINLFNRNLLENIRYGRIDATDEDVIEAAEKAKAHKFISNLPESYHSVVGERGIKLSGGERQRIAIARAILKNAPILFLDEATNQLDAITEHEIQKSLNELMRDKTTIVIAHRFSTILHLDRILVFDKGKIVQDGIHHDLITQDGLYKILWKNQSHGVFPVSKEHTLNKELK